jgi:hypothetical protein
MATRLKDLYGPEIPARIAATIPTVHPPSRQAASLSADERPVTHVAERQATPIAILTTALGTDAGPTTASPKAARSIAELTM